MLLQFGIGQFIGLPNDLSNSLLRGGFLKVAREV
jgi:hypothetical protein